jgi:hypothetical protein
MRAASVLRQKLSSARRQWIPLLDAALAEVREENAGEVRTLRARIEILEARLQSRLEIHECERRG